jgi:hypothetical protein
MMQALEPRDRPAVMEYTAPVPGAATTEGGQQKGNAHRSNLRVRALLEDTLLAVLGTVAERDAAVPKAVGSAERPATRRTRLVPRADPLTGLNESGDTAEILVMGGGHTTRSRRDPRAAVEVR